MPRFGFGSPNGISLNSPKGSSFRSKSSSSNSFDREHSRSHASGRGGDRDNHRDGSGKSSKSSNSRRRNFGFLKSGIGRSERNVRENQDSLSRRREHAKQLANLAYSDDPTTSIATTATSVSTHETNSQIGVGSNSGSNQFPAFQNDPFGSGNDFFGQQFQPKQQHQRQQQQQSVDRRSNSRKATSSRSSRKTSGRSTASQSSVGSASDGFDSLSFSSSTAAPAPASSSSADPFASFDAFGTGFPDATASRSASTTSQTGTAPFVDHINEFSEMDFFSDQMAGAMTPVMQARSKKRAQQSASTATAPTTTATSIKPVSLDHFFDDDASSFSSNHTYERGSNGKPVSKSVAARRRMRSHMQKHAQGHGHGHGQGSSDIGSASSVGSGTTTTASMDIGSTASSSTTSFFPPPQGIIAGSPHPLANNSNNGSSRKNRVAAYSRNSTGSFGSATSMGTGNHGHWQGHGQNDAFASPFRKGGDGSGGGSVTSSNANLSASSPSVNLFDADPDLGAGFTFDAFGLDESQVEREVNDAMQDILGSGGFSIFVDKSGSGSNHSNSNSNSNNMNNNNNSGSGSGNFNFNNGSNHSGGSTSLFPGGSHSFSRNDSFSGNQTDVSDDSFAVQNWDSSPSTSRNVSPVPLHYNQSVKTIRTPGETTSSSKNNKSSNANANKSGDDFMDGFNVNNNNNIRRSSDNINIIKSDDGFMDGFHVNSTPTATPQKQPSQQAPRSAQQRRFEQRNPQKGGNSSHTTTKGSSAATPPPPSTATLTSDNLRKVATEPPRRASSEVNFATSAFDSSAVRWSNHDSNPWQDDPFASSDDGRNSDFFSSGKDAVARRLYSETKSNVHDYYATGTAAAANAFLDATSPLARGNDTRETAAAASDTKSDVGISSSGRFSFESTSSSSRRKAPAPAAAFFQLPPREDDAGDRSESDESDDVDQMQDDLAHEFARDIVRKTISPTSQSLESSQSRRNRYFASSGSRSGPTNDGESGNHRHRHAPGRDRDHETAVEETSAFETREQHADYRTSARPVQPQTPKATTTTSTTTAKTNTESTKRFGSFRSRYEAQSKSKIDGSSQSIPDESSSKPPSQSPVPKWKQSATSLQSQDALPADEKKEEERSVVSQQTNESTTPRKINSLKARWESKTRPPAEKPLLSPKAAEPSERTRRSISDMEQSFEMLTPDVVEQRRQARNKSKFDNLRKQMGVTDEAPSFDETDTAKSETGGWRDGPGVTVREQPSPMSSPRTPRRSQPSDKRTETRSDVGTSSSFLSNVRLRKVASPTSIAKSPRVGRNANEDVQDAEEDPPHIPALAPQVQEKPVERKLTYRERREMELKAQREKQKAAASESTAKEKPPERKLTYRERREMELKAQREREEKNTPQSPPPPVEQQERKLTYRERREIELRKQRELEQSKSAPQKSPKKDVASLIRKRISANKSKTKSGPNDSMELSSHSLPSVQGYPGSTPRQEDVRSNAVLDHHDTNETLPPKNPANMLENMLAARAPPPVTRPPTEDSASSSRKNSANMLENMLAARAPPAVAQPAPRAPDSAPLSRGNSSKMLENMLAARAPPSATQPAPKAADSAPSSRRDSAKMLESMLGARAPPAATQPAPKQSDSASRKDSSKMLENMLSARGPPAALSTPQRKPKPASASASEDASQADVKSMLSGFLSKRSPSALPLPAKEDDTECLKKHHVRSPSNSPSKDEEEAAPPAPPPTYNASDGFPALKDDPKFERYFRMLKMGLPMEVAKHAMVRDGLDPSVLDLDPNKPVGVPLKDDPKFQKFFKMLKVGLPMEHVKHAMIREGLNPDVMDQDHNLPVVTVEKQQVKKKKETHRRARLHWKTIKNVVKNSLWANVQSEVDGIDIDEEEFNDLFQADLKGPKILKSPSSANKKGAAVRVIDSKRANNGGIILARLKLTHDQMAQAVDKIDDSALSGEQIENVIEYLPTKEERDALEKYMLEGGQDAAEKFEGLCECEKFMVSMMTVKHAKRKVRALLFKLQFMTCMESIAKDAQMIDIACDELVNSIRLRQLLGIILQFGNRLNTAGNSSKTKAGGFSLESLSKLSQAKAFDKKTTFLHYIILIVQRNNELLLKFYDDIPTVLESETVFWDQCQQDLEEVENQLENVRRISLHEARANDQSQMSGVNDDDSLGDMELTLEEEVVSLRATTTGLFTLGAIKQVSALREKIERTKAKCVRMNEYFGVANRDTEPQEIFSVFVSFTKDFQKAKEQVFSTAHKRLREDRKKARQRTPKKSKSPPRSPSRATPGKPLKASNHQPNMGQLFGDIKNRSGKNGSGNAGATQKDPRADLLGSIKGRQSSTTSTPSSRASLLSSIKERQSPSESPDPRANLLSSIQQRKTPSENDRAGLMNSIKHRQPSSGSDDPSASRAGLLDAIKERKPPPANDRLSLLSSIKARKPATENAITSSNRTNNAISPNTSFNDDTKAQSHQYGVSKQTTPSTAESPRDKLRQKAMRMQRSYSNPRISTNVEPAPSQPSQEATTAPISTRSPRDAMRYRRRRADIIRAQSAGKTSKVTQGTQ